MAMSAPFTVTMHLSAELPQLRCAATCLSSRNFEDFLQCIRQPCESSRRTCTVSNVKKAPESVVVLDRCAAGLLPRNRLEITLVEHIRKTRSAPSALAPTSRRHLHQREMLAHVTKLRRLAWTCRPCNARYVCGLCGEWRVWSVWSLGQSAGGAEEGPEG